MTTKLQLSKGGAVQMGALQLEPTGAKPIAVWREKLLGQVLRYTFWLYGFAVFLALVSSLIMSQGNVNQGNARILVSLSAALVPLAIATFPRCLTSTARAIIFSSAILLAIGMTLLQEGVVFPNPLLFAAVMITILAVAVGRRFATVALMAFVAILLAGGLSHHYGVFALTAIEASRGHLLGNWIRVALIFGSFTSLAVMTVSFLSTHMTRAVERSGELSAVIKRETYNKIKALQAKQDLQKAVHKARELQALGRLATGVANDFNNLLVVIINNAALLQQTCPDESLADIQEAGTRAARLCQQLLTIGKKPAETPETLPLAAAVDNALTLVRRLMPPNIDLIVELDQDTGQVGGTDMGIEQIVFNLCLNARDAMPNGGQLRVSTMSAQGRISDRAKNGRYALLRISDTGQGMDETTRSKIFEPFFTTKNTNSGTGLGLAVVAAAVARTCGYVEVTSTIGKGSTFSTYLPRVTGQAQDTDPNPIQLPLRFLTGAETLLVVENNDSVRRVLSKVLQGAGYTVISCSNGFDALRQFRPRKNEIALLITDAVMPHFGGKTLYERLLAYKPDLPVVFCSGCANQSLPLDYLQHPRRVLVSKPFTPHSLRLQVRKLLNQSLRKYRGGRAPGNFLVAQLSNSRSKQQDSQA